MPLLFHPLVVHFPVALWLTSFLFDLLGLWKKESFFAGVSRYLIGLGLLGAAVSGAAGFLDYVRLVAGGIGQAFVDQHRVHSALAYGTTALYAGLFIARWRWARLPSSLSVTASLVGAVLISATSYLGGEIRRVM
jgi:uncharacterized membrane protein